MRKVIPALAHFGRPAPLGILAFIWGRCRVASPSLSGCGVYRSSLGLSLSSYTLTKHGILYFDLAIASSMKRLIDVLVLFAVTDVKLLIIWTLLSERLCSHCHIIEIPRYMLWFGLIGLFAVVPINQRCKILSDPRLLRYLFGQVVTRASFGAWELDVSTSR